LSVIWAEIKKEIERLVTSCLLLAKFLRLQMKVIKRSWIEFPRWKKNFEKQFDTVDRLLGEIETLKKEVDRLSKLNEGFRRFEVEQKKKCILVKGLTSNTKNKFETRNETWLRVKKLFDHINLKINIEDYQRLGPIKQGDTGSTLVRIQFYCQDDKSLLFDKFKDMGGNDEVLKKLSLIQDYPSFQLSTVKKLSDIAYEIRKKTPGTKTRIVPRGLDVKLQKKDKHAEKWTTVSTDPEQSEA
jgi:hypothetical protein